MLIIGLGVLFAIASLMFLYYAVNLNRTYWMNECERRCQEFLNEMDEQHT